MVVDIISSYEAGRTVTALSYESLPFPPSLTKDGQMFHGVKADVVVPCIVDEKSYYKEHPYTTCIIIDGASLVGKLKPTFFSNFDECIHIMK